MMTMTVETFLTVLMMVEILLTVGTTMQIFLALAAPITRNHAGDCSVQGGRGRISFTAYLGEGEQLRSVLALGEEERSSITACLR